MSNGTDAVGSPTWLRGTGGRLTLQQSIRVAAQAMWGSTIDALAVLPRLDRRAVERRWDRAIPVWEEVEQSPLGQALLQQLTPGLWHHSSRSYLWGTALLDDTNSANVDYQVASIAALAHDIGLVGTPVDRAGDCFTLASIEALRASAVALDTASGLNVEAMEWAIAAHFQPRIPVDAPPEAVLLARGTAADVVGARRRIVPRDVRNAIVARWPHDGFRDEFARYLRQESRRVPQGRTALLRRCGMPVLLRLANPS